MSAPILTFHEGRACDLVSMEIERRLGVERANLRSPEKDRVGAPVEFTCELGGQLYAIEHTGIEPFSGHVQMSAQADLSFTPITKGVEGLLPDDDLFELHMPTLAMQPLWARQRTQVQAALIAWILAMAPTLPHSEWSRYTLPIVKVQPPGVPFEVSLFGWKRPAIFPHPFSIKHLISDADLSAQREARVRAAWEKKIPKLAAWKRDAGARTVLVMEDIDIQLTNPQVVYEALVSVEKFAGELLDEVHLVTAVIDTLWWVHALRVDGVGYYQLAGGRSRATEIETASLVDSMAVV